jgi:hypothetical protein
MLIFYGCCRCAAEPKRHSGLYAGVACCVVALPITLLEERPVLVEVTPDRSAA